jgi:hypothetical protein
MLPHVRDTGQHGTPASGRPLPLCHRSATHPVLSEADGIVERSFGYHTVRCRFLGHPQHRARARGREEP